MTSEWRLRPLGEITENFDSVRAPVKESDRRPGPYPYYGASGVVDHVDDYLLDGEYLLIAEDGENLRTRTTPIAFMATGRFWVNNHAHIVRGNHESDTRFLMYALAAMDVSGFLTGSTMPKLTQDNLNRIPISAPSLSQQQAIAHVLGSLDDKIALNRRISASLESMARAMFKSWFVDFDPVRAKAEGKKTGLRSDIEELFPASFQASEIGNIPNGWIPRTVQSVADCIRGASYKSADLKESDLALVTLKSFRRGGGYQSRGLKPFAGGFKPTQVVKTGELVIACTDVTQAAEVIGRPALVGPAPAYRSLVASLDVMIVRPNSPGMATSFLYCLAGTEGLRNHALAHSTGTTVLHLSRDAVPGYLFPLPPETLVRRFCGLAEPLFKRSILAEAEAMTLSEIRDVLLPILVSGQLKLKNARSDVA